MREKENQEEIGKKLITWYAINKREMPWRQTKDPYTIWLSEIILQQTQVVQGTPYFEKFILEFPTLQKLAVASEDKVLKMWQGLGYYSRARNLLETAQYIFFELNGNFPNTYSDLLKLKGVGEYTAAAIASIAYAEPVAVVDGNVVRVISRLFKIEDAFDTGNGKKIVKELANQVLVKSNPAESNQAIMELGSLICRPQNPDCVNCPVEIHCISRHDNTMLSYPKKAKKTIVKKIFFNFIVVQLPNNRTIIIKRTSNDIWKNMYTFPLYQMETETNPEDFLDTIKKDFGDFSIVNISKLSHTLSHRLIDATFFLITLKESGQYKATYKKNNIFEVEIKSLKEYYSLPRLITKYMETQDVNIYFNS